MLSSLVNGDPNAPQTPYKFVRRVWVYSTTDDGAGQWGAFNSDGTGRPSFTAMGNFIAVG
jgi:hypothetical protein